MRDNIIVTGVTGMDGSNMVDYLLKNTEYKIYGMVRRTSTMNYDNLREALSDPRFELKVGDLSDGHSIESLIKELQPAYFINFAAQSFVGSSWTIAEYTFDVCATALIRIYEAIRKYAPWCRVYNAGCYDSQTRIVTRGGIKSINEIEVGDFVQSLNPQTSEVEYKKVKKLIKYNYKGKMLHFKGRGKDIMVTPNHNMYYEGKNGLLKCRADEFIKKACVKYPFPKGLHGGNVLPEKIDLLPYIPEKDFSKNVEIESINALDLMYLIGLYIGDGSSNIMEKHNYAKKRETAIRDRLGRYTGEFAGEARNIIYRAARCTIDIPEGDPAFRKVTEVLFKNNINWTLHGQCDITFFSWGLYHFFNQCGHKSSEKMIPDWVFDLNKTYQEKVFEGIMDSDGCLGRKTIEQTSKILAEQLLFLSANIGLRASLSCREPRDAKLNSGRTINGKHKTYTVSFSDKKIGYQKNIDTEIYKSKQQCEEVDYDDYVWCLEVEDNHNFMTVRDGKTVFCGNSSEEFGDVIYSPQNMDHPFRPQSPYGAAKCAARHLTRVYRESYKLYIIQGLLYNHEGIRRSEEFVTRKITKGVARIKKAIDNREKFFPIQLGNIYAKRDWSDSEDFVDGIWRMLNQEEYREELKNSLVGSILLPDAVETAQAKRYSKDVKEYILSSGETHTVKEFVEKAFAVAGIDGKWVGEKIDEKYLDNQNRELMVVNEKFYRPAEVNLLLGDSSEARKELGWAPRYSFDDLVRRMVEKDLSK